MEGASFRRGIFTVAFIACSVHLASARQRGASPGEQAALPTDIRGDEELVWEQPVSAEELPGYRFLAYVDGRRQVLSSVACAVDASGAGLFRCTAPLPVLRPGVHVIEVAASSSTGSQAEGVRSTPIVVRIGTAASRTALDGGGEPRSDVAIDRAWTTAQGTRLRATVVAERLEDVTDLLPLADGRVFIAERSGRVRVLRDGALQEEAAVAIDDLVLGDGRGLLALAADPAFASTRRVFAIYTTVEGLRVARFTVSGDHLVDRAVMVDGLPVAATQPAAALRSAPDGRLYLALDDGGDPLQVLDMGSYRGKVLRFNTDGTTPADHAPPSPIWSVGVSHPVGLGWSVEHGTFRVIGTELPGATPRHAPPGAGPQSGAEITRWSLPPEIGASRAVNVNDTALPGLRGDLLVASTTQRGILRVWSGAGDTPAGSEWLVPDLPGPVTAVTVAPDGSIYAAVHSLLVRIVSQ